MLVRREAASSADTPAEQAAALPMATCAAVKANASSIRPKARARAISLSSCASAMRPVSRSMVEYDIKSPSSASRGAADQRLDLAQQPGEFDRLRVIIV